LGHFARTDQSALRAFFSFVAKVRALVFAPLLGRLLLANFRSEFGESCNA